MVRASIQTPLDPENFFFFNFFCRELRADEAALPTERITDLQLTLSLTHGAFMD